MNQCIDCGIVFSITDEFYAQVFNSGESFKCPKGHSQFYTHKKNNER